jgi:hypothetical protein
MRTSLALVGLIVTGTVAGFGALPVGRVISTESIDIDGISAPARNFVPVELGGEVKTGSAPATIQFSDGTRAVIRPNSTVKIDGRPGSPELRVLRGSAQYNMIPAARPGVSGDTDLRNKVLDNTILQANATLSPTGPVAETVLYRATPNSSPEQILPGSPVSVGSFPVGSVNVSTGTIYFTKSAATGGATTSIITPTGVVFNLTPVTNPTTGAVTYTITSITDSVTNPLTGKTVTVTVTSGTLIGATLGGITPSATSGSQLPLSITPAGSLTPLTPAQASSAVQAGLQSAVNTAIANGTLPAGTPVPSPSPVSTGQFSNSAT